jgi:hypothetical protein
MDKRTTGSMLAVSGACQANEFVERVGRVKNMIEDSAKFRKIALFPLYFELDW